MNDRVELPPAREVCPTTTRRLIGEGALLVDVRERAEVERVSFDVPAIVVIPMSEFEQHFAELPRDRDLVLVCKVGERSLKAAYFLMYHGYTRVANMAGGIDKWARKGFPIKGTMPAATTAVAGCCGAPAAGAGAPTLSVSPPCGDSDSTPAAAGACCSPAPASSGRCC